MEINKKIFDILKGFNIDRDEGLTCLLAFKHNITPDIDWFGKTIKQLNLTHIYEKGYENKDLIWKVPLYQSETGEAVDKWDWVTSEYREMFKDVNKERAGSGNSCVKKMKKVFAENPEIRKEDVIEATKMYLSSFRDGQKDPQYLSSADYFIRKYDVRKDYTSKLEQYLELYFDNKESYSEEDILKNRGVID